MRAVRFELQRLNLLREKATSLRSPQPLRPLAAADDSSSLVTATHQTFSGGGLSLHLMAGFAPAAPVISPLLAPGAGGRALLHDPRHLAASAAAAMPAPPAAPFAAGGAGKSYQQRQRGPKWRGVLDPPTLPSRLEKPIKLGSASKTEVGKAGGSAAAPSPARGHDEWSDDSNLDRAA
jgi:hypothetical protein